MLASVRVPGPVTAPVSLEEVREHLRVDHTVEDRTLKLYVDAATGYLEGPAGILGRLLMTQSWRQAYPGFSDPILIPVGLQPVQSVTSIKYFDASNVEIILSSATYRLVHTVYRVPIDVLIGENWWIERVDKTMAWPITMARDDAVTVEVVVGDGSSTIAAPIKKAMLDLIGHWYNQRETASTSTFSEVPYSVTSLLINQARIVL